MITDQELAYAIGQAVKSYNKDEISAGILIRDIRKAIATFYAQPSMIVRQEAI